MKNRSVRAVLGFYPAEEGNPEKAYEAVRTPSWGRVCLFRPDGTAVPAAREFSRRYSALRLDGEYLVMAEAAPEKVHAIVELLRGAGSPAVFVLREDPTIPQAIETQTEPPGPGRLEDFARKYAERRGKTGKQRLRILSRLRDHEVTLEAACRDLAEAARLDHALTAAAEWLLENAYLVHTHIAEIRRNLPRDYPRIMPGFASGHGYAHVLELAQELVAHTDCSLNQSNISDCLRACQTVAPLTMAELWIFPLLLRMALIEALTSLAVRVSRSQQLREAAYLWANRLAAGARMGADVFERTIGFMETEPIAREPYFAICLAEQLQDQENALAPAQCWIEERLKTPLSHLVQSEHAREAAERIATANAFSSLRTLSRLDFPKIFEAISVVEAQLRTDPGGIYPRSDFATRDQCRHVVEQISRYSGISEVEVARRAVMLTERATDPKMRHVAYYLMAEGVAQLEAETNARPTLRTRLIRAVRRRATAVYLGGIIGLTACFAALSLLIASEAGVRGHAMLIVLGALSLFPLSELAVQIVNALVISLLPPDKLPKMDFREEIPPEHATLVVVPMMLSSLEVVRQEVEKLEVRFLANRESNLFFSLFADFTDATAPAMPGDTELLQAACDGIAGLNARYPGERFLLFHRGRTWSESEQRWIARERKRGKIEDLNAFLCGEGSPDILRVGRLPLPIRYVITLDADTQLPPTTARRMIETIAHPLNRVEIDPRTRTRRRGYAIIQPRISIALPGATATRFTRIFANTAGTDPYSETVSDAQQDLFAEAIFHGKAIYDLQAFHTTLKNRFPPESLLSHDLIEGAHAGVGLANDIELFENLPLTYVSYSKRQHRWIRGDWQIAPWTLGLVPAPGGRSEPNPLTIINRWRIFDNLRRSLVPIASLLLLLFGWLISAAPGVWSVVVGLAVAIPAIAPLLEQWARRMQGSVQGWQGAADELVRAAVMIAFLPHQAWQSIDAISRALYRRKVSRRNLLEWETAEATAERAHRYLGATLRQLLVICGLSLLLMIALYAKGAFAPTFAFVAMWAASPALMRWLSHAGPLHGGQFPRSEDVLYLRQRARLTWRYFDDLVGADTNWLPPDNSQLALHVEVAQRTSPTNIGFWLTSALAARDFGYLTADDLCRRCSETMTTLERLERCEGHLLNWYDIRTLEPLAQRYVSTVDSGNLLASLWVLEQGCRDTLRAPIIGHLSIRGLSDTLSLLRESCARDVSMTVPIQALAGLLRGSGEAHQLIGQLRLASGPVEQLRDTRHWPLDPRDERFYWASHLALELASWTETVDRYLRWMETLAYPPDSFLEQLGDDVVNLRLRALHAAPSLLTLVNGVSAVDSVLAHRGGPDLPPEVSAWLDQLAAEYAGARANAAQIVKNFETLAQNASRFAAGINMRFLYDVNRGLFGVGYSVGGPIEFTSHYDLLASECRLASLVAIAKGDVPIEHWLALARPRTNSGGRQVLLSWSGTMFEYLMPHLFTRTFANSLLDYACREAVREHIGYGREKKLPWGASESAYSALDANKVYQYRAFGVPALALTPGLEDDLVVAPYATMLALAVDPATALDNLRRFESLGLAGPMGFYEAIDFSRRRKRDGEHGVVIYAYMAHHQGMSLLAMDNMLHRDIMQRRFHGDLRVRAIESLLFERIPVTRPHGADVLRRPAPARAIRTQESAERTWSEETPVPRVHLQGNGRYALMMTNSGGGYSRWNEFDLTRWRSDATLDQWGSFLYIRDLRSDLAWAAAYQPFGGQQGTSTACFSSDRAEFHRRVSGIETVMEVTVAVEDDVELRRLTVTNRSLRSRRLEFTSYAELALAPHADDKAHPAFSKMFVETEYLGEGVLLARRRPRSPDGPQVWAAHILSGAREGIQYETDRAEFLGRGNTPEHPAALRRDLTGSVGAVLDPIFSLRSRVTIEPRERIELTFLTLAASSREALIALIGKYRRPESVVRAFEMAWTRAQLEFRYLGIRPSGGHRFQELAGHLLYPNARLRAAGERLARNRLDQSALWGYGISGDLPMLTVIVTDDRGLPLVRELLLAHTYWRLRGFRADLIIFNQETPSYDRPLYQHLLRQVQAHSADAGTDCPGGVFLRDWNAIPEEHRNLILSASSVVLNTSRGPLHQQLAAGAEGPAPPKFVPACDVAEEPSRPLPFLELAYFNQLGGFTKDGREYAIYLEAGRETPAPWANVMVNRGFGAMVTESGLGYTWRGNSQANRLTPWHNDPVSDPQSEIIYLRDDDSGAVWTPTALPIRERDAYRARHGQGYTVFEHNSHAIDQELTVFVPVTEDGTGDPVKVCRLRLRNGSSRTRRLTITYVAEWVLGSNREDRQLHVQTTRDEASGALLARQSWNGTYAGHVAFAAMSPGAVSYSCDRAQFLGRNGSMASPAALERVRLENRVGSGLDPAAALQLSVNIDPGRHAEIIFLLGQAETLEDVRAIVSRYRGSEGVERSLEATRRYWDAMLGVLQVRTPLRSADLLLNRWLLYQALGCRFWGRSALYQSGGAFGFRDQLQDSMAFLYASPELARSHILAAASRQFLEGDVQHWWHPEDGLGVRTRCADDLLWLPYTVARYVELTGDLAILDEQIPFLQGEPLKATERERMFVPAVSVVTAPLWEHCRRAFDRAWRLGEHGLPLFGGSDWNDGLNRVGIEGHGESVWLGWFVRAALQSFVRVLEEHRPGTALAAAWRRRSEELAGAIERSCWDGEWYLRGFFDNGAPLGSHENQEARIDSLSQSWAVISMAARRDRARRAMESAERHLVDRRNQLVLLLTPPFDRSEPHPGYIMGYPPGIRENGGQYTHGAVWLAMAWARMGDGDRAVGLLQMMNPLEHTRDPEGVTRYRGEPYVVAADVSAAPGKEGRSGWTWYTGSAAWMYRTWIEEVLGFRMSGDKLRIQPVIPDDWPGFEIRFRYRKTLYEIVVRRRVSSVAPEVEVDGLPVNGGHIQLIDDGVTHQVIVQIAPSGAKLVEDSPEAVAQEVRS